MHPFTKAFQNLPPLDGRVDQVLRALPGEILREFEQDPRFRMSVDDHDPARGRSVWLASPGVPGSGSRCVVLKPALARGPEAFALYIIAHELAHAYLRNGGCGDISDAEAADDAVAASWGFHRPGGPVSS
jgi:hypothetical protein